ncbi:hypothetical protein C0992_012741 [Termitomyces sp. T32_za158]|nr:hypothetical protein C0992_012741 [Termitomyces sp. T32_za158]
MLKHAVLIMADFIVPSSSRSRPEQKWTVSPEFGDALLAAMRERSDTRGPLPCLPSMIQLPSPEVLTTHALSSPTKLDNAERLKMKTRVAIRDRNPHRFQVVPLHDAAKYSTDQKLPRRERQSMESAYSRGQGPVRGSLHSWKKGYVNENDPAPPILLQDYRVKTITLDQPPILSERNRNIPARGSHFQKMPVSSSTHVTSGLRLHSQPLVERSIQSTSEQCLPAKTKPEHNKLHHKSTSLGNLRTKLNLDIDLKANPLPRVNGYHKRTNTLSADYDYELERAISTEPVHRPDRHNPVKKDSIRRHAIYTQSLYVPALERPNETSAQLSDEFFSMPVLPLGSTIPVNPNKLKTFPTLSAGNALRLTGVKSRENEDCLISQSSISSIYSQDEHIRALNLQTTSNFHHPIIIELLAEVEKAILDWSTS